MEDVPRAGELQVQIWALAQLHLEGRGRCRLFPLQPVCFWEEAQHRKKKGAGNLVMGSSLFMVWAVSALGLMIHCGVHLLCGWDMTKVLDSKQNACTTVKVQLALPYSASAQGSVSPWEQSWWGLSTLWCILKRHSKQAWLGHLLIIKPCQFIWD